MRAKVLLVGVTLAAALAMGCQGRQSTQPEPATPVVVAAPAPTEPGAPPGELRGSVNVRQPAPLPNGAIVFVRLADVSLADAPLSVLGEQVIRSPQGWPISFAVPYDPTIIDPSHRYEAQVRIEVDGKLHWINTTAAPVLNGDHKPVEVWVELVSTR